MRYWKQCLLAFLLGMALFVLAGCDHYIHPHWYVTHIHHTYNTGQSGYLSWEIPPTDGPRVPWVPVVLDPPSLDATPTPELNPASMGAIVVFGLFAYICVRKV